MYDKTVIITAAGLGKRMNNDVPKQFLLIHQKPILAHTIECFYDYDQQIQIILTLPDDWINYWKDWCTQNQFAIKHTIVSGGKERYHSIQKALSQAEGKLIAIHDGVRPLVSKEIIQKAFDITQEKGNAIPVFPVKESIRFVQNDETHSLDRKNYFIVQTPQVFQKKLINQAYQKEFHESITDDASLVEEMGEKIHVFEGNEENIKITTPLDLKIANEILKLQDKRFKTKDKRL